MGIYIYHGVCETLPVHRKVGDYHLVRFSRSTSYFYGTMYMDNSISQILSLFNHLNLLQYPDTYIM